MIPTFDQIQRRAYLRWEHGGHGHGRDREDWLAAEHDLLFDLNYEITASYPLDDEKRHFIGHKERQVCRFCERSAPSTTFVHTPLAVPAILKNTCLFTFEDCDECHAAFHDGPEGDLARFLTALESNRLERPSLSIAALKAFTRMAISIMPGTGLEEFEGAIEWINNPDHEFDAGLFQGLGCYLHATTCPPRRPWTAVARRHERDTPLPSMIFFVGGSHVVFEIPVPFGAGDDDFDGENLLVPLVSSIPACEFPPAPSSCVFIPLSPDR